MTFVLDTHVLVPMVLGRAPAERHAAILSAIEVKGPYWVSVMSLVELGDIIRAGRIAIRIEDYQPICDAIQRARSIVVVDLSPEIARNSFDLPERTPRTDRKFGDRADRLILATARTCGAPLLTTDDRIIEVAQSIGVETV